MHGVEMNANLQSFKLRTGEVTASTNHNWDIFRMDAGLFWSNYGLLVVPLRGHLIFDQSGRFWAEGKIRGSRLAPLERLVCREMREYN
jgi:hypothetical protein